MTDTKNLEGLRLFDAECGFCTSLAERFAPLLGRRHFGLAPLQTPGVATVLRRRGGSVLSEMVLLMPDGSIYSGADALVEVARRIGWARPLYWLAHVPGVKPMLRRAYAWVASHRHCLGGACRAPGVPGSLGRSLLKWLPALALPALAMVMRRNLPGWEWMWVMAFALFLGAKWLTVCPSLFARRPIPRRRLLAYCLLWPGMDAVAFCAGRAVARPPAREWAYAAVKTVLGAGLVWEAVPLVTSAYPLAVGWVGMVGLVFVLHFGLFHLLSLSWRSRGIDARPIMHSPVSAPTLSAFWGGHWNLAFRDLMHRHVLIPLARELGMHRALVAVFLGSGLVHELVISLPARGGYGWPTLYFATQGLGLLLERSRGGRRMGLGRGWSGRLFALGVAAGPVFWLFHPPFIHQVILPMLRAFGAL